MGTLWKVFLVIWLTSGVSGNWENFGEEVYELAKEIVGKYFQAFRCVTWIAEEVGNGDDVRKLVPGLVMRLGLREGSRVREDVLREVFEQGCGGVIVQTEGGRRAGMVRALVEAKQKAALYRYNRERYLFLPVSGNDSRADVLLDERMFFLPNLVLVAPEEGSRRFLMKGHRTFEREGSGIEVVDAWSRRGGFEEGRDLYPDRILDVRGKELVLGLMQYVPYSVIVQEGNKMVYDGVETRIAKKFVEAINGTWIGLDHPVEMWGKKFANGSGSGIYGSVQRHAADLGYSAIYQWYCDVLDCSYPYIQAEVTGLVPKPRILTGGMTVLHPFRTSTWIAFFVAYFVSCSFVFGLTLASGRISGARASAGLLSTAFHSAYDIFRLQLHQVPRLAHGSGSLATFIKIALFYHFLVSLFWQGGITSILTVPRYEKPIDSAEDLVSSWPAVKWGADHGVWTYSIEDATEPVLRQIVKHFLVLDEATLLEKTRTRDFAFFVEKLPNDHYGFRSYINADTVPFLRPMKNYIYKGFVVMILPRGSPYTEKLDHVIHWLFATGVIQKMENQVSLERIDNHLQVMIRLSDEKQGGRTILTVAHIKASLYIYAAGILAATAAFIAEKLILPRS